MLASAAALGAAPLTGCAWLDRKEAQLALRPTPGRPAGLPPDDQLFRSGDQRWLMPVLAEDGSPQQLALWWLPHQDPDAPSLLYLHGTFRNLYRNLPKIDALRDIGFSVLAVDYRGWGDSTPMTPSEDSIAADAAMAWAELVRRQPLAGRRVIFGHSMGGSVAVRLATALPRSDFGGVVLESTFTRMPDVAAEAGFLGRIVSLFTTLKFNSISRISGLQPPLLMLHGTADTTVPVALGRRLRDAAAPGVQWVEIEGGTHSRLHSEAPQQYRAAFKQFMHQLPLQSQAQTAHRAP